MNVIRNIVTGLLLIITVVKCLVLCHISGNEVSQRPLKKTTNFTIEDLLTMRFSYTDIRTDHQLDMDPCKSGLFMGDIAMPDINYENRWEINKSMQQEIEKFKQEVYHEGLQVEEEGLSSILRKKTKYPESIERSGTGTYEKVLNEATINDRFNSYNYSSSVLKLNETDNNQKQSIIPDEGLERATKSNSKQNKYHLFTSSEIMRMRNIDSRKIQSNSKDITHNGENILSNHNLIRRLNDAITTTELPYWPSFNKPSRNVYGNVNSTFINTNESDIEYTAIRQKRFQTSFDKYNEISPSSYDDILKRLYKGSKNDGNRRVSRAATAKKDRIWDYGVIPYEIDGNFSGSHKALFKQAMRHWENFTCIKFVERNPTHHPNYIVFTERPCGCCSFVGKRGNGPQAISIGKNCDKFGIVVHELGHVVGFWHEHTRPDREKHVVIEKNNIMKGQEYNFNKLTDEDVNSLGQSYDYDSIMHYARNTFSKGTYLDTILPIEMPGRKRPEIGQRIKLSEGDIAQANLLYKCAKCGRTFQENSGMFHSPGYYIPTNQIERCEWRITATHGERIMLNITDLDILKSSNCKSDYLQIHDGYWQHSPELGKFCGSGRMNDLIISTGPRMLLTFTNTQQQPSLRGFAASYEAICGGEMNLETGGRLESPNYPLEYLPNKECIWKITVPKEYQVALKFQSFEVENHDNCVYDYVEVRDGDTEDSKLIGVFCGYKIPPDMQSTTNKLFVKFISDGSVQKAGFSATFMKEVDECDLLDHGCEHECRNTLGGYECACQIGYELHSDKKGCENACGGILNQSNGTITSPSFPKEYPMLKECVWVIVAPEKYKITLNFTHFDLEGNAFYQPSACEYDSLSVFSKMSDGTLKKHSTLCGSIIPNMITSESNVLRVEFKSDKTIQKTGFAAIFITDIDECAEKNGGCQHECRNTIGSYVCSCHNGFTLHENGQDCKEGGCKHSITEPAGNIFSPNYPREYPSMKDCVWHFTTTPGHRIRLVFNIFEIEPHQECAYDHISIYDGSTPESHNLGKFCGSKLPYPISSTFNEMYMVFNSDLNVQRKGFFASHSTVCGGHLQATSKVKHIYSHARFGDATYDSNADCEWTIEASVGRNIQLSFIIFDIELESTCLYDYVEVFSGFDDSSGTKHGKFCGSSSPHDIISLNEEILVRFKSDDSMEFKGFSLSFVVVDPFEELETFESSESEEDDVTPFPGSLKNVYQFKMTDDNDDYSGETDETYYHNLIQLNQKTKHEERDSSSEVIY